MVSVAWIRRCGYHDGMNIKGHNLIGFTLDERGREEHTFTAVDPGTGEKLDPRFIEAPQDVIDEAVMMAVQAFPEYSSNGPGARALFLENVAHSLESETSSIIERCCLETGLPTGRLEGELKRTTGQTRMFADLLREGSWVEARIDMALPDRKPVPKPDIRQMLLPLGPVAVFGASNFPLAFSVAGGDTVSALAAGCPVIVKAHPAHPGTSELVGRVIAGAADESGMPEGVFSMIHGVSGETGIHLVKHSGIAAVGFTGSFKAGMALRDAVNSRKVPIPLYAEMGSVNPVFILPGALSQQCRDIAEGLAASVILGAGQFCTNPGLVFISGSRDAERFIDSLKEALFQSTPAVMLTAAICGNYENALDKRAAIPGVKVYRPQGTETPEGTHPNGGERQSGYGFSGVFGVPALLETSLQVFLDNPLVREEAFGPCTVVVKTSSVEELFHAVDAIQGELSATFHGTEKELEEAAVLIRSISGKVGRIIVNGFPTGVEVGHAMHHGGPFPATLDAGATSVGALAIRRFCRPVCFQNMPGNLLPDELKDENPLGIHRLVDGIPTPPDRVK